MGGESIKLAMFDLWAISSEFILLVALILVFCRLYIQQRRFAREKAEFEQRYVKLTDAGLRLLELKDALEREQEKSEKLLHNILPARVIADLQEKGASAPERFDDVSILFADIINFTGIAPTMEPDELIVELNDIFGEFDRIFALHNCERLKTVGDSYMAVGGLNRQNHDHCRDLVLAAMEARDYLAKRNRRPGARVWQMRFGVNSGSVIGGIVGREKYIYDIFGDTVNTASRIEHASEAMKINVSGNVYKKLRDNFDFTHRGMVEVKGKGALEMFFVNGVKSSCQES
ncbi:MAG: adenylate/guanylate cyclase domain-containing protein [Lentisphaeria bacterium]|nr:adenylate/guanylate cyclase domain-containing protein [Lentisphaeria bacterium]